MIPVPDGAAGMRAAADVRGAQWVRCRCGIASQAFEAGEDLVRGIARPGRVCGVVRGVKPSLPRRYTSRPLGGAWGAEPGGEGRRPWKR
jgi:hypothetical protein